MTDATPYRTPPPALQKLLDAPLPPGLSISPDSEKLLQMKRPARPTIAEVAAEELKLAGRRISQQFCGSRVSWYCGMALQRLPPLGAPLPATGAGAAAPAAATVGGLPSPLRAGGVSWSHDSSIGTFTHLDLEGAAGTKGLRLYALVAASGQAHAVELPLPLSSVLASSQVHLWFLMLMLLLLLLLFLR